MGVGQVDSNDQQSSSRVPKESTLALLADLGIQQRSLHCDKAGKMITEITDRADRMPMKALLLDSPGAPETLRVGDVAIPQPGPGEVRVQVQAAGLNPVDYKMMTNGVASWRYPFIPGLDVAGVIDEVGEGVEGWNKGDAVFYHGNYARPGGFADFTVTTTRTLVRTPGNLSAIQAAALPCAGFTAFQALIEKLNIQSGQTILVRGGAGGVGGFAIQIAAKAGLEVITTASSRNAEWVKSLGAAWSIDYTTESITERINQITNGSGVDAIIDTVGIETATEGLDMLAFNGGIACVARLPDLEKFKQLGQALSVHDINLGGAYRSGSTKAIDNLGKTGKRFADFTSNMGINPMVTEVITLDQVPDALTHLSKRNVRGKIVAQLHQ